MGAEQLVQVFELPVALGVVQEVLVVGHALNVNDDRGYPPLLALLNLLTTNEQYVLMIWSLSESVLFDQML